MDTLNPPANNLGDISPTASIALIAPSNPIIWPKIPQKKARLPRNNISSRNFLLFEFDLKYLIAIAIVNTNTKTQRM